MRLSIYPQQFHIQHRAVFIIFIMFYINIPSTYLSFNCKLAPFYYLLPILSPPPTHYASGDHKSDLFVYGFVCLFLKYNWRTTLC